MTVGEQLAQATALHARGELDAAAALYLQIIRAEPQHFDALHMLGVYSYQTGNLPSAHSLISQALRIKPDDPSARVHFSAVLQKQGRLHEALTEIHLALKLAPNHTLALNNGATLLSSELKRPAEALQLLERALRLDDTDANAWNGMGYALIELRRLDEALLCLARALQLQPDFALALYNRGNALQLQNRLDDAMRSYDAALALDPDLVDAQIGQSACRLLMGDLPNGFKQYQWRWRKPYYQQLAQEYTQPLWLGDTPLSGKTLLVHHEQGFGDTLQMVRYLPLLAAQGARVILRVPATLKIVLASTHASVIDTSQPLPAHDLQIPLMSIPLALGTRLDSIPAEMPYLHADPARSLRWQTRLGVARVPRIGLAWAGNPDHSNDSARSLPLLKLRRVLQAGLEFITLQRDLSAPDRLQVAGEPALHSYAADQHDFAETAALIAQLDLVICVDTSIAHLAGAMGKPVWLLLPHAPDWRWLLRREDSPWYPTMRLFRQQQGDWDEVLDRVATALKQFAVTA